MPYDPSTDQYYFLGSGYTSLPERDGSDYNPDAEPPSWFVAWFEVNQHIDSNKQKIEVVIVAKMYQKILGCSATTDMGTLQVTADERLRGFTSPQTEEEKARYLFNLGETPEKLIAIYIRILD